jgi:TRAP-type mannitol/chloroaromatic compound transport system substrate-binding protein
MKTLSILAAAISAVGFSSAAVAHDTESAYASRGACEAATASTSNFEKVWLTETFPEFFDTIGEAASFLTRAWTCDRNTSDGQYYITDHVEEVLASDWYQQRNH